MKPFSFFKIPNVFFGGSSARSDRFASSSSAPEQNTTPGRSGVPPQRSALQGALLAQMHARQKRKEEYFKEWDTWAKGKDRASGDMRKEAVKRMKKWFKKGRFDEVLDLRNLNLTCLPGSLPPFLQKLDVSGNALDILPTLPPSLKMLNVAYNSSLFTNNFDSKTIVNTNILSNLPSSLEEFNACSTGLQSLTDKWPPELKKLDLSQNQLTRLRESIVTTLRQDCIINLENNRLSPREIEALQETINAEGYDGPIFSGLSVQQASVSQENNHLSASSSSAIRTYVRPGSSVSLQGRANLRASELTQLLWHEKRKQDFLQEWDAWAASKDASPGEKRKEAVEKMKQWFGGGDFEKTLDLKGLGLISLPEIFPLNLQNLDISRNQLRSLPENLPPGLQSLDISRNQLRTLPENLPLGLQSLDISRNKLRSLPENLPPNLRKLDTSYNLVPSLPENLPSSLRELRAAWSTLTKLPEKLPSLTYLDVSSNQLESLPTNMAGMLGENCVVVLQDNPLSEKARELVSRLNLRGR